MAPHVLEQLLQKEPDGLCCFGTSSLAVLMTSGICRRSTASWAGSAPEKFEAGILEHLVSLSAVHETVLLDRPRYEVMLPRSACQGFHPRILTRSGSATSLCVFRLV